jgi:hypothetical protein
MFRKLMGIAIVQAFVLLPAFAQSMPQTARQALIEMFSGKVPGSFDKHLPEATLAAMHKSPPGSPASMVETFSVLTSQMQATGKDYQTFDTGPILMSGIEPKSNTKFEINVVRDDLRGQDDEIEISFTAYKNGESQTAGFTPRFTFDMQQEKSIWRLHGITFSVGISLTDPTFLKAIATPVHPQVTTSATSPVGMSPVMQSNPTITFGSPNTADQNSAAISIRAINTAEVSYAATYPAQGFACSLSSLGGMGGGSGPDDRHAMLLEPRLSSGRKGGYTFRISNCSGSPASTYQLTATPAQPGSGARAFCSDQSGAVRFSEDGVAESCLNSGKPLP